MHAVHGGGENHLPIHCLGERARRLRALFLFSSVVFRTCWEARVSEMRDVWVSIVRLGKRGVAVGGNKAVICSVQPESTWEIYIRSEYPVLKFCVRCLKRFSGCNVANKDWLKVV